MSDYPIDELMRQIQGQLTAFEETVAQLSQEIEALKDENNRLRMQQYQAVDHLSFESNTIQDPKNPTQPVQEQKQQRLSGQARLQTFYNEGIHICHHYFGSQRETHEECIFCQDIIDSLGED